MDSNQKSRFLASSALVRTLGALCLSLALLAFGACGDGKNGEGDGIGTSPSTTADPPPLILSPEGTSDSAGEDHGKRAVADAAGCPAGSRIVVGTAGDDVLEGTSASECFVGLAGDDVIFGGGGSDLVLAGAGDDYVAVDRAAVVRDAEDVLLVDDATR